MADARISDLTAATTVDSTADYLALVQGGTTKKVVAGLVRAPTFKGCRVTKTAAQSISSGTPTKITWDSAEYDTNSFWSGGANTRLTVPSGVTKVILRFQVEYATAATGIRVAEILKNGAMFDGTGKVAVQNAGVATDTNLNGSSGVLTVNAGDYFELQVFHLQGSAVNVGPNTFSRTWFEMVVVEATVPNVTTYRGALLALSGNAALSTGDNTISWASATRDTSSFWSAGSPTRLTVPSGVTLVRVGACGRLNAGSSNAHLSFKKNNSYVFAGRGSCNAISEIDLQARTAVLSVSAGDYFECLWFVASGNTLLASELTWFELEVVG